MSDIRLTFIGDTYVSRADPDSTFSSVAPYFRDSDIVFCNLETVVADAKYLDPSDHNDFPRTDEWMFDSHVRAGINVVSQANNPNTYHGRSALLRSVQVVEESGVAHGGAGRNLVEARRPAVIERSGTTVAFVCRTSCGLAEMAAGPELSGLAFYPVETSYGPSSHEHDNPYNYPGSPPITYTKAAQGEHRAELEEDIQHARTIADVVVVAWHWGLTPYKYYPGATYRDVRVLDYQRELGHMAIDFGADLIVGTGSHHIGPIEVYRNKPIFYSLGNFVHDKSSFDNRRMDALLVRCLVRENQLERVSYVPGQVINHGPPEFTNPEGGCDVVELIRDISKPYGTQFEIGENDVTVVLDSER